MRTLIIDTTVEACSVALVRDGVVLSGETEARRRGHAEELIPMIQRVIGASDDVGMLNSAVDLAGSPVDHILVTTGPGTFTGVRVGISAARGLGLAIKGVTLHGIDTLKALALSAVGICRPADGAIIVSAIDARRGDLYAAIYRADVGDSAAGGLPLVTIVSPKRCDAADMIDALAKFADDAVYIVGSGGAILDTAGAGEAALIVPELLAPDVSALAEWADVICASPDHTEIAPLYLRPPDATLPKATFLDAAKEAAREAAQEMAKQAIPKQAQ